MLRIPIHLTCTAALGCGVTIIKLISRKRKLRLREVRTLAQGHTVSLYNVRAQTPVQIWTLGGLGLSVCGPQASPRVTEGNRSAPTGIL